MNSVKADTTNELFKAEIAGSERLRSLILIGILGLEALLLMIIYFFYHTQYLLLFNTTIAIFAILIFTVLIILYEILIHYLIKKKVRVFFQHRNILGYINAFSEITLLTGLFIFIVEYSNQTIILQAPATLTYELNTLAGRERKTEEEFAGSNTFPNRGMHLNTRAGYYAGLNEETDHFLKLSRHSRCVVV